MGKNTKEMMAARGSMDEMNARLGRLRDTYRQLSEEERNNPMIGGVMQKAINELDEELKGLDKTIGNNQRNVGNYEIASKTISFFNIKFIMGKNQLRKKFWMSFQKNQ